MTQPDVNGNGELRSPSADPFDTGQRPEPAPPPAESPLPASTYTFRESAGAFEAVPSDGRPSFFIGRATTYPSEPHRGQRQRTGLFQATADLPRLQQFGSYDFRKQAVIYPEWAFAIWPTVIAESRGYYGRINSYDRAQFTFGFYQLAAHTPNDNLILLFRRLLSLSSAKTYFPDLELRPVGGKLLVHLLRDGTPFNLEGPGEGGELDRFMSYLNEDDQRVDNSELRAAARLLDWTQREEASRQAQVDTAITIASAKLRTTIARAWNPQRPLESRLAIWVSDIRHQGRGGTQDKTATEYIREALASDAPELRLKQAPGTAASRIAAVERGLADLDRDRFLSNHVFLEGRFQQTTHS